MKSIVLFQKLKLKFWDHLLPLERGMRLLSLPWKEDVSLSWIKDIKKKNKKFKRICHSIREDGVYVEAGENDNDRSKARSQSKGLRNLRV